MDELLQVHFLVNPRPRFFDDLVVSVFSSEPFFEIIEKDTLVWYFLYAIEVLSHVLTEIFPLTFCILDVKLLQDKALSRLFKLAFLVYVFLTRIHCYDQ